MSRDTKSYIVEYDTPANRVEFQFLFDSFSEGKSANWGSVDILGRSEPLWGYTNSGARNINLELRFLADKPYAAWGAHLKPVNMIKSWVYPRFDGAYLNSPPKLRLKIGTWFKMTCICDNYTVAYNAPWDISTGYPFYTDVSISLTEANDQPFHAQEVRDGVTR